MNKEKLDSLLAKNIYLDMNTFSWKGITKILDSYYTKNSSAESYAIDPRDDSPVLFSPGRNNRPSDNGNEKKACRICEGDTPPILDFKEIGNDEFAFININPYPFLNYKGSENNLGEGDKLLGTNLLFWPTTKHIPIYELGLDKQAKGLELLAELEFSLQTTAPEEFKSENKFPHVQIIKNYGAVVGGSLEHEHYQIGFTNKLPKRIENDKKFFDQKGISFAGYLGNKNPEELEIKDYGSFKLVTPYFMRRPLETMIIPKDNSVSSLHGKDKQRYYDLAGAIKDVTYALSVLMPKSGREFAYNLVFHTGPIGSMYVEVLPFTQGEGGFEKSGLNACQSTPLISTNMYKEILGSKNGN